MAQTIDSMYLKWHILPRLAHLLMILCRYSEVVTVLRELGENEQALTNLNDFVNESRVSLSLSIK